MTQATGVLQKVGFIGLGLMGGPMAANVARAGYPLTVYNRSPEKLEPLLQLGAQAAASPKAVAEASEVVITMLSDAAAVEATVFGAEGLLAGAHPGMVLIDSSTIAPDQSRSIASRLLSAGVQMLDAPVMGSTGPAAAGQLTFLVGGEEQVLAACRALLSTMGKDIYYLGPSGSGASLKLCMNLMVAAEVVALSEAVVMARKAGIDPAQACQIIAGSNIASNFITRKANNIAQGDFRPAFPLKHLHKDLGLIVRTAHDLQASLPTSAVSHQLFSAAMAEGYAAEDCSAIYRLISQLSGLEE